MGVRISVQKFDAPSYLRLHHTDHCEHLYFLVSVRERSADASVDFEGAAGTHETFS